MAGTAGIQGLGRTQPFETCIVIRGVRMRLAPVHVRLERAVAGFTTDGHFGHGGVISIGDLVIVFLDAGVVAFSAPRIPVHAPASPMSPFARMAVFVAIDIEPLIGSGGVRHFLHLPAATRRGGEELLNRIVANDALHLVGRGVGFETGRYDLEFAFLSANGGGLGAEFEGAGRVESWTISVKLHPSFSQSMRRFGPTIVFHRMALDAAF